VRRGWGGGRSVLRGESCNVWRFGLLTVSQEQFVRRGPHTTNTNRENNHYKPRTIKYGIGVPMVADWCHVWCFDRHRDGAMRGLNQIMYKCGGSRQTALKGLHPSWLRFPQRQRVA
jgi:hypothetical protein